MKKEPIGIIQININGDFALPDGRIGTVKSNSELAELDAFLGVLRGSVIAENAFDKALRKICKRFGATGILEIRSQKVGQELVHSFSTMLPKTLSYEDADQLLSKHGWSLDCWSPLEISKEGSTATGEAARIVLDSLLLD